MNGVLISYQELDLPLPLTSMMLPVEQGALHGGQFDPTQETSGKVQRYFWSLQLGGGRCNWLLAGEGRRRCEAFCNKQDSLHNKE